MIRTIFLDMDDVCNQFMEHAFQWLGYSEDIQSLDFNDYDINLTEDEIWDALDFDFWSTIPKSKEFDWLVKWCVDLVGLKNIVILTGIPPSNVGQCVDGKLEWLGKYFDDVNYLIGNVKHVCAKPTALLIDDSEINCNRFRACGGEVVLVPRSWNCNRRSKLDELCSQFVP